MAEENDIALIESYLQGELSAEEKRAVEQRLARETDFKLLFEDTRTMIEGLGAIRHKGLLGRIDELEKDLGNPLESKKEARVVYWSVQRIAAVFIGLAIVAITSWYVLKGDGSVDGAALYEEYYTTYMNVFKPSTRGEEEQTLMVETFGAYDQGAYDTAAGLFDRLLEEDNRAFVRFYAAITYLENNENEKATDLLTILMRERGDFETQATWYLALNYLKTENYDNAKSLLEGLIGSPTAYQKKAQELLKKMK